MPTRFLGSVMTLRTSSIRMSEIDPASALPFGQWHMPVTGLLDLLVLVDSCLLPPAQARRAAVLAVRDHHPCLLWATGRRHGVLTPCTTEETRRLHDGGHTVATMPLHEVQPDLPATIPHDPAHERFRGWMHHGNALAWTLDALVDGRVEPGPLARRIATTLDAAIEDIASGVIDDPGADDRPPPLPSGACCVLCAEYGEQFAEARRHAAEHELRARRTLTYPYAVLDATAHRSTCRVLDRRPAPTPPATLAEYVHGPGLSRDVVDPPDPLSFRRYQTSDELHRWITRRIGNQGGLHYTACATCRPELPDRLSDEWP